jgi:hypothetical protein
MQAPLDTPRIIKEELNSAQRRARASRERDSGPDLESAAAQGEQRGEIGRVEPGKPRSVFMRLPHLRPSCEEDLWKTF